MSSSRRHRCISYLLQNTSKSCKLQFSTARCQQISCLIIWAKVLFLTWRRLSRVSAQPTGVLEWILRRRGRPLWWRCEGRWCLTAWSAWPCHPLGRSAHGTWSTGWWCYDLGHCCKEKKYISGFIILVKETSCNMEVYILSFGFLTKSTCRECWYKPPYLISSTSSNCWYLERRNRC